MATDGALQRVPFGDLLRRYRQDANLTQAALAARSGLSIHAISMLEPATTAPPRPR